MVKAPSMVPGLDIMIYTKLTITFKVKPNALKITQVVYWESVLRVHNSGIMSLFVKVNIFISVYNFDQSAYRVSREFLMWLKSGKTFLFPFILEKHIGCKHDSARYIELVEMCSYIFISFCIGFTRSKNTSDVNMIHRGILSCLFRFPLEKQTVVKQ